MSDIDPHGPPTEGKQGQPTTRSSAPRANQTSSGSRRARDAGSSISPGGPGGGGGDAPAPAAGHINGWRISRTKGYTMSHPFIAVAPGCPEGRHPTRECGCRVFRTEAAARAYIAERVGGRHR